MRRMWRKVGIFPGKLEDVYKVSEGWDPLCKRIVEKTPEDKLVDWKLVYR